MKALVTGGTGFIGSHLAEALAAAGVEVQALVRDPRRLKFLAGVKAHILEGDLHSVPRLPPDLDWVFHVAGLTKALKKEDYYSVNQKGTASLLDSLAEQGLRPKIVLLSSLAAAGPSGEKPGRREDEPSAPVSPYGRSKLAGEVEALARRDRFPLAILRVGAVYGPRDSDFLEFFRIVNKGWLPVFGRRPRTMCVCYVADLVRALVATARTEVENGAVFNIGDARPSDFEEIGLAAARILGRRVRRVVVPLPVVGAAAFLSGGWSRLTGKPTAVNRHKYRELRQAGWVADVNKAKAVLGFETTTTLEAGLKAALDWYQARGLL